MKEEEKLMFILNIFIRKMCFVKYACYIMMFNDPTYCMYLQLKIGAVHAK